MTTIRNTALLILVATLAAAGCKKSEPGSESQSGNTQQAVAEKTPPETEPQDVEPAAPGARLAKGVKLEAAGKPIDIEVGHLVPRACDWNNDGRKDLIVGQFAGGSVRLYLNEGTDAAPVFGQFSLLQAGGKPIKLDAG